MLIRALKLGSISLFVLASFGLANAADVRIPVKAPPAMAPAAFSWAGCYVGGYVGGAWDGRGTDFTDLGNTTFRSYSGGITAGRVENPHSWNLDSDRSLIGGGTLGCNWQLGAGSPFVIGIEGEAGYLKLRSSAFDPLINPALTVAAFRGTPDVQGSSSIGDWYGMITGRLGYAWDRMLIYAKGGAAFVPVRASVIDTCNTVSAGCGNWLISTTDRDTVTTWTVGGGIEWALANNWSLKAEYMFIRLDETLASCGFATAPSGATVGGGTFCFSHDFGGIHTAKIGLNYRFGSLWR